MRNTYHACVWPERLKEQGHFENRDVFYGSILQWSVGKQGELMWTETVYTALDKSQWRAVHGS
jgi:hypothetical protein